MYYYIDCLTDFIYIYLYYLIFVVKTSFLLFSTLRMNPLTELSKVGDINVIWYGFPMST